jgi:histidinol-phosphate aminotransferase
MIPYNKNINKIITYTPGKSGKSKSRLQSFKLSSNESPLSLNKKTLNKIKNIKITLSKYPDPLCKVLREKISKKFNIKSKNILFGNGSDEIFYLISYCFLNKELEGLYSKHGFLIYPIAINAASAKCVYAKEKNFKADVFELIKKSNKNTRVCFIANPNNPTGTYLTKKEIKLLREGLPKKCLLVIDSAYSEYVIEKDYADGLEYAKSRNDIIVTKTFSKIYGMAALRLGWAYCPEGIANTLNKIRPAFNINSYAQSIAEHLLDDEQFLKNSIEHNLYWKEWLTTEFKKMGFTVISSVANFILVKFHNKKQASILADNLEKSNIYVRKLENYKLNDCLRISVGSENDLKKLVYQANKIIREKKNDFI